MFDKLFERPHAILRQQTGPLVDERRRYLEHLEQQGFGRKTLRDTAEYTLLVARRLRLSRRDAEPIGRPEIESAATKWASRSSSGFSRGGYQLFVQHATQWLGFLGRLQVEPSAPRPYADLIHEFAEYLQKDRRLSPQTIRGYCWMAQDFVSQLGDKDGGLASLTVPDVDQMLMDKIADGGYARHSVQSYAGSLRAFFRFAQMRGACRWGLAETLKPPRVFPHEPLPCGPSREAVQQLLESTEGDRPKDIRAHAILQLLAVYGLRASEVTHLRLEDFDWEQERLSVRRAKSQRVDTYPLSRPVGDAVLRYLQKVRPRSVHREVFLTQRAPFRPIHNGLWYIVSSRLKPLGLAIPHQGPHALRHACATHLLSQGLTLKEIGDHLGHTDPEATRIYAKVDLLGLRRVAELDLGGLL